MKSCNPKSILGMTAATLLLAVCTAEPASAQYGGRSTGGNFATPHDARAAGRNYRAPQARSATESSHNNDQYDPQVWLNGRRGWSQGAQQAGGFAPNANGAVRQAAHHQPYPIPDGGVFMEGDMMMGPGPEEEYWGGHPPGTFHEGGPGCSNCGDGACGDSCGDSCGDCGSCQRCCCMPCIFPDYWDVFAGVQGFKGPRDFGANGNFGFHEGFNAAGPLGFIPCVDLNYQIGLRVLQSNLSGTIYDEDYRHQSFVTAGVFHYQECGLNYGAVWDWQRDQFYDHIDVNQVRGQVSLRSPNGGEIGFLAAVGTNDDLGIGFVPVGPNAPPALPSATWEVNNQFVGFYRWNFECGGDFRLMGGFTGSKDGLVGSDFHLPMNDCWSIYGGFTYMIPSEGNQGSGMDALGTMNEMWNISLSLVYTFGKKGRNHGCGSPRPMFDVADNGSMLIHEQERQDPIPQ